LELILIIDKISFMRIIVAEDDDINRELILEVLSDEGYEVIGASDGIELIKYALEKKPDLIITDIQMPNMSGDTTVSMIESYNDLASVPIIIMTGMSRQDFNKLGISRDIKVLFKPLDLSELKNLVKSYLSK
jgi:CheY-like chemotaxis protein